MNYLEQLFPNLAHFSGYAPGVDASTTLDDLQAAANSAFKRIKGVLTEAVFNLVMESEDELLKTPLRLAVANMTLHAQLVFDAVNRRKNDVDVYKYELEGMKRSYMENYYNAVDTLITAIAGYSPEDDDTGKAAIATAWAGSRYGRLLGNCPVKSADDFDTIYNIDGSQLFFFRTLAIQKELYDARLEPYFEKVSGNDRVTDMLRLVLCKKVVATALRRFDILECPATVRNLFDDSTVTGLRKDEREQATALANLLDSEADNLLDTIDTLLSADEGIDNSSWSAYNQPDDVIVMMP